MAQKKQETALTGLSDKEVLISREKDVYKRQSIIRPYIASGEISLGKKLALTISAFSLLTEYLMAFAPCCMVLAFAIIMGKEIYSVR